MGGNYAQNGGGGVGGECTVFFHKEYKPLILWGRILLKKNKGKKGMTKLKIYEKNLQFFIIFYNLGKFSLP